MTKDERSIGDLFSELANETGTLIRQEVALAQAEITQKATDAGKNAASIAIGGFVGYAAFLGASDGDYRGALIRGSGLGFGSDRCSRGWGSRVLHDQLCVGQT